MTRIATGDGWRSALLDLMSAQARQSSAQERFTTGKTADDLKGFGRGAESLIAMRGLQDRVRSFIEAGEAAAARLETQSLALDQLADAAKNTRQARCRQITTPATSTTPSTFVSITSAAVIPCVLPDPGAAAASGRAIPNVEILDGDGRVVLLINPAGARASQYERLAPVR